MVLTETSEKMDLIDKSMDGLQREVSLLSTGCQLLSKANSEANQRLGEVEAQLKSCRSESNQRFHDLERQLASISNSILKRFASTSDLPNQVSQKTMELNLDVNQLGYRNLDTVKVKEKYDGLIPNVDIPVFNGRMPYGWICRMQRFFRQSQYAEEQKLVLVPLCLEGDALKWYAEELVKAAFVNWLNFQKRLLAHFAPDKCNVHSEVMLTKEMVPAIIAETELVQKVESPVVEALHEKSGVCLTCCIDNKASSKEKNLLPSMLTNVIEFGANVELSKHWTVISEDEYAYQIFPIMSHQPEQLRMRTKKQKWSKSWRFKFKNRAKPSELSKIKCSRFNHSAITRELQPGFECVTCKQKAEHVLHNRFIRRHKLQQRRKKRISPKSWMFKFKKRHMKLKLFCRLRNVYPLSPGYVHVSTL